MLEFALGVAGGPMSLHPPEPSQFSANIICPKCSTRGVIVWEKNGAERTLVSLPNGFYERLAKKAPFPIELVCSGCDTAQPEN